MSTRTTESPPLAASVDDLELRPVRPADQVALTDVLFAALHVRPQALPSKVSTRGHESNSAVPRFVRLGLVAVRPEHDHITMLRERAT